MSFFEKYDVSRSRVRNVLIIILLLVFLGSAALFFIDLWESENGKYIGSENTALEKTVRYNGKEYVLNDELETYLFLGLDKFETNGIESYYNDKQADFLMLFVVDDEESSFTALHINRDTVAEMNVLGVAGDKIGTAKKQIALAHTYGNGKEVSCRNTANAVSKLLMDAEINHYISVTMDAVPVLNDQVGGVEITVLDDFSGIDDTLIKGEKVTLMGEHALNYVRTRYNLEDSSNNHRMIRQRQYVNALYEQAKVCYSLNSEFIGQSVLKLTDYIVSDCSVNKLQALAEKISAYEFKGIVEIEGESKLGKEFMEFYPDEDSLKSAAVKLFYKLQN